MKPSDRRGENAWRVLQLVEKARTSGAVTGSSESQQVATQGVPARLFSLRGSV